MPFIIFIQSSNWLGRPPFWVTPHPTLCVSVHQLILIFMRVTDSGAFFPVSPSKISMPFIRWWRWSARISSEKWTNISLTAHLFFSDLFISDWWPRFGYKFDSHGSRHRNTKATTNKTNLKCEGNEEEATRYKRRNARAMRTCKLYEHLNS